jgi:ATP-dependent DNA helicase Q4
VVVSPLISLMRDQLKKLPVELPGVCFSGKQTAYETAATAKAVLQGHAKVVFVSPERLCSPSFRSLINILKQQSAGESTLYQNSSAVGLVCIDEAHCLSQWSYNFRPSFLRIKRELDFIRPAAVLALTATANSFIQKDIMQHLGIGCGEADCVLSLPNRRINLKLVARLCADNDDRFEAVLKLVKSALDSSSLPASGESADANLPGKRKRKRVAIDRGSRRGLMPLSIVYVWRRDQVDSMCEYLKAHDIAAVAYHAGMDSEQRERSQRMFDNGTARCVVATVAFGMGVDKADVRQVIHCYMVLR